MRGHAFLPPLQLPFSTTFLLILLHRVQLGSSSSAAWALNLSSTSDLCGLTLSSVCSSCDAADCECLSGTCVSSVCVCSMPDTGDYCEQVASCQLASWDLWSAVYRWLWTALFALTLAGIFLIAAFAIRNALKKVRSRALLKKPATLFWLFICIGAGLRLASMATFGIAMDSPAAIFLYNLPVALLMAAFLLIGLMWLYMLKRIKSVNWSSRKASAIVVSTIIIQLVVQMLIVGASLFVSPAAVQMLAVLYQVFVGLSAVAFLAFVVPTTIRVLRLLRQVEDFVNQTTERKSTRERAAIRRVAISLIGACALVGLLLVSFGFATFVKFTTSAFYFLVCNFLWRFIEFSSFWLLAYIMSTSRATGGGRSADGSASTEGSPATQPTTSLNEVDEQATDAELAPL